MQSLRLVHPEKGRFWDVHWEGAQVETCAGALGTNGRSTGKVLDDAAAAETWVAEQIAKRRHEGFVELATEATTPPASLPLQAIEQLLTAGADDEARLVFADTLVAAGDPLGEFIQVQVRLALTPRAPEASLWRHREKELLARHRLRWSGGLRGVDYRFERGFAVSAHLRAEDFNLHAAQVLAVAPFLTRLHVASTERWMDVAKLAASPGLARLTELHFAGGSVAQVEDLASANLGKLRALSLRRFGLSSGDLFELVSRPACATLEHLDVRANRLSGTLFDALARLPLRTLIYANNALGQSSVSLLGEAGGLSCLRKLDLSGNRIADSGVAVLASSSQLAGLVWLGLGAIHCTAGALQELGRAPFARTLRSLDLSGNALGAEGARAMTPACWPDLRALALSYTRLGDRGLDALLATGLAGQLERLELRGNELSAAAASALVREAPKLTRLSWLTVSGNPLGAAAVKRLTAAFPLAKVVTRGAGREEE